MVNIANKMGEIGECLQRMKGNDAGNTGDSQLRMPTRVLRNSNEESSTNVQTTESTDANNENPTSLGESLINDERVEDSDFVLPREAITMDENRLEHALGKGSWRIRNNPIFLTKWSPNMSLTKDKVTKVPVWVKMHKVPIVAYYEDGLSLIATQVGKPIMLDGFTSEMCDDPWGRLSFVHALIEITPKTTEAKEVEENDDGFTTIRCKKELKNNFDALRDQDGLLREVNVGETSGKMNDKPDDPDPNLESYDSEVEELIMESDYRVKKPKGASTPSAEVSNV
ncbi:hypothetical protein Tco_1244949 [Tanacetum coccineum]